MIRLPEIHSEKTGKSVPQNTTPRIAMNAQLLSTKLDSRESTDSRRSSLRSSRRR